jgi:hypothetical protein
MKRAATLIVVVLALSCKDSTKPLDPWVGTWKLVSVNTVALPASVTINGFGSLVVFRTLAVGSGGTGLWTDSTLSASTCGLRPPPSGMCDAGGSSQFSWTVAGDTLTFLRTPVTGLGYVANRKTFVKHGDAWLLKTDENQTELYHR